MPDLEVKRVRFTEADIKRAAKRKDYIEGIYCRWKVASAEATTSRNGNYQIRMPVQALRDPEDANSTVSRTVYNNLTLPQQNPHFPGHEEPDTAGLCAQLLRAMFPEEIPEMPYRIDGVLQFQGEAIEKSEEQTKREEVMKAVHDKLDDLWDNPEPLVGQCYYGGYERSKKDPQYLNIVNPSAEPKQELTPPDQLVEGPTSAAASQAPQEAKKAAKPKPASVGKKRR
jgi:hypothetical protein